MVNHQVMMREQEIYEILEEMKSSNILVIVEGKKDKSALKSFGIENVMVLKKALHEVIEEAAESNKEIILLTDLDKEGKQLYGRLNSGLQKYGVRVNNKFRDFLMKNTKLRQIEGLRRYADAL